MAHFMSSAA